LKKIAYFTADVDRKSKKINKNFNELPALMPAAFSTAYSFRRVAGEMWTEQRKISYTKKA